MTSAAWNVKGDRLLATDVFGGRLLSFSLEGRRQPDLSRPGKGPLEFNRPTWVLAEESGFQLLEGVSRWLRLDSEGRPAGEIHDAPLTELGLVQSVVVGNQIHGLGYQKKPDATLLGLEFLRMTLEPYALLERGESISFDSREMAYVDLLGNLVASVEDRSYALRFEQPPRIEALWPTRPLRAFPSGFAGLPALPESSPNPAVTQQLYGLLARAKMPVALYGWGKALYLLTREPEPKGGTRWLLHEIDPVADRRVRALVLPTKAAHLLIAPGAKRWAIFEKSPVGSDGHNTLEGLLLLPPAWFSEPDSPLEVGKPEVTCAVVEP